MTILNGHFNGTQIILDDPVPQDIRPDTPVRVLFAPSNGSHHTGNTDINLTANGKELSELATASEKNAAQTLPQDDFSDWENAGA